MLRRRSPPPVFWDVVEESLDEAEYFWRCRDSALRSHEHTLADVETSIEERLIGALDGLCVPGAPAIERLLAPALEADAPERAAAAAHALLAGGTPEGTDAFVAAFLRATDAKLEALRRGLELASDGRVYETLARTLDGAPAPVRAAFVDACAFRGLFLVRDPGDVLASKSPELQRAAARLLRHAPVPLQREWTERALGLPDRLAREAAVETALIAGAPGAWSLCRDLAAARIGGSGRMLLLLAQIGSGSDNDVVVAALGEDEERQRQALRALGYGGRRAGADACAELLRQGRHPELAAEALCAITGLDLAAEGLLAPPAPEPEAPLALEDDDLDADLVPTAEDLLPAPDAAGVAIWWNRNRARFDDRSRYLRGRPCSLALLQDALATEPMRRRHAIALELAVRTQGRSQVQTWALAAEQRRQMAALAALPREAFAGPFARI